ncbi:MAG: EthD domain-containing protein [Sphingobium sp.]
MVKVMGAFCKRADLTPQQFRDYYEKHHVPLIRSLLPGMTSYKRNYVQAGGWPAPPFDVITEIVYESPEALARSREIMTDPEVVKRIQDDEHKFIDRRSAITYIVDEVASE